MQGPACDLLSPGRRVSNNVSIEAAEISQMTNKEMAVNARLLRLAKSDQVPRIKLKIGVQMKRPDVMYFQRLGTATDSAHWMRLKVMLAHCRPLPRTCGSDRMLPLRRINQMFDYCHRISRRKKARARRA
jgi:hypothetical protein